MRSTLRKLMRITIVVGEIHIQLLIQNYIFFVVVAFCMLFRVEICKTIRCKASRQLRCNKIVHFSIVCGHSSAYLLWATDTRSVIPLESTVNYRCLQKVGENTKLLMIL